MNKLDHKEVRRRCFIAQVESCNCGTKTSEHALHDKFCPYRVLEEAGNVIDKLTLEINKAPIMEGDLVMERWRERLLKVIKNED